MSRSNTDVLALPVATLRGSGTVQAPDGSRQPSAVELDGARYLGKRVGNTAAKLTG